MLGMRQLFGLVLKAYEGPPIQSKVLEEWKAGAAACGSFGETEINAQTIDSPGSEVKIIPVK